jgi:hypothetical protein
VKRLSEARRRTMTYLTHAHGNFAAWKEYARGYVVFDRNGVTFFRGPTQPRTVAALKELGLVEQVGTLGAERVVATAEAWALAHKGELR